MRKEVIVLVLVFLMISLQNVFAQSATQEQYNAEIAEAFACVDNNVQNAGTISLGEAVFGALADVKNEKINSTIEARRVGNNCYAETGTTCKIKDTAQVVLAKLWMDKNVDAEIDWLKNQTGAIQGLTWYLQITIENNLPGECIVKYQGQNHEINVKEDLKLEGSSGSCLEIANSDYWLMIKDSCIDETFEISCGNGNFTEFFTNLLYKKTGEDTTFISSTTNRKSANAWATEEITALCFKEGGDCNYEASLWATFALYKAGEETGNYAPYLRALSTGVNERFFPSAFSFRIIEDTKLTDEQYNNILSEQRPGGLFRVGNTPYNEFYDTALAMMALGRGQGADATELRESAVPGLFNEQDNNGCFGSPRDTAFILHASGWSREELPQACAEEGERTSIEEQICCSGLTKLPDKTLNASNNLCVEGAGYGYCTSKCGDGIKQQYENACSCPIDFVASNTCVDGQWFTGNPLRTINTSSEKGYCDLVDEDDGWENGCCVSGLECVGSGSNSICEKIPEGTEIVRESECYQGSWYNASGARIDTTAKEGSCHLASGSSWPYGCCPQGYECNYDEGNESESICERRPGGGGGSSVQTDCSLAGYYCVADPFNCLADGGVRKRDLDCPGFDICCSIEVVGGETCTDKGGIVCQEDEQCNGAIEFSTTGPCCTGGVCEEQEDSGGGTGSGGSTSGNKDVSEEKSKSNIWWWVLFFGILIILVILGIVYRDRIRVWMFKMKGKASTSRVTGVPPGGPVLRRAPPSFGPPRQMIRPMGRPVGMPPAGNVTSIRRKPASEKEKEMDETLRKLKEMSG